ncbi:hypothetical protein [Caloranaerobacter ferrireducens]|uniref:hypothetical protein n=1 Tax=Caloranaerobacter ferrireducens TaxID=1323370 RepID=UPI00084DAF91|nr:hypothetical protein [Caloranaerobacter ferrireducens]
MKNNSIKSKFIITITVVSLLFNFYLFKQNYRKHEIIIKEYTDEILNAKSYLRDAYNQFNNISDIMTTKRLYTLQNNLESAQEYLYRFGRYFNYTGEKSMSGFTFGRRYLDAYIYTVEEWIEAVEDKNSKEILSVDELESFKKDLKNIIDKLDNKFLKKGENYYYYSIDDLTYYELHNIFEELVKETSNERINYYLKTLLEL